MPLQPSNDEPVMLDRKTVEFMLAELDRLAKKIDGATNFAINNKTSLSAHPPQPRQANTKADKATPTEYCAVDAEVDPDDQIILGDSIEGDGSQELGWSRWNDFGTPLVLWIVTDVIYDHTGDKILYAEKRRLHIDSCGKISSVDFPILVEVDEPGPCEDP